MDGSPSGEYMLFVHFVQQIQVMTHAVSRRFLLAALIRLATFPPCPQASPENF